MIDSVFEDPNSECESLTKDSATQNGQDVVVIGENDTFGKKDADDSENDASDSSSTQLPQHESLGRSSESDFLIACSDRFHFGCGQQQYNETLHHVSDSNHLETLLRFVVFDKNKSEGNASDVLFCNHRI